MLRTLFLIVFISKSAVAASLGFGNKRIQGVGTIRGDNTSLDIHLELTSMDDPQPSAPSMNDPQPSAESIPAPASVQSTEQARGPTTAKYQQDIPSFGVETAEEFHKSALDSHNKFRAIHNSPPLKLNMNMSKEAEEFAKKLFERGTRNQSMVHEDQLVLQREHEGENLAAGGGGLGGLTAYGAVKNWYNEVCAYNWSRRSYEPQAAHFMQVIWKGSTELGIGKAEGKKNGRRYSYIVARYRPAISFDALNNVFKGKFNPSYCGVKPASSLSDSDQYKPTSKVRSNPAGKLSKHPSFSQNEPSKFRRPLFEQTLTKQPITRLGWKETRNPTNSARPKDVKYRKVNLKITREYPYGHAGNSWGAYQESRMPAPLPEYHPKQAEVLEEFIEGDDPAEKANYEQAANDDDIDENGENGGFTQTLIPLMNSEDAEIGDDSSEDELATKSHVPKHTN